VPQIIALPQSQSVAVATTPTSADAELPSFQFIASWALLIAILVMANKTRIGHVLIYYSLLLMILFILVSEFRQVAPLLSGIMTIGEVNSAAPGGPPNIVGGSASGTF
jgi:ABC-type transport system involved in cytochrome bd biosynthesis fused ATPase/permease subunit